MIIHRTGALPFPNADDLVLWETCLRKVLIGPASAFTLISLEEDDEVFTAQVAYEFLLEIVCGLHSRILGENEIVGQFKKRFLKNAVPPCFRLHFSRLPQMLLTDMKRIRTEHPLNSGTHSYGSFVRKEKAPGAVTLFGTGELALAIFPWVSESESSLRVMYRSESGKNQLVGALLTPPNANFLPMESIGVDFSGTVVIAAPLSSHEIIQIFVRNCEAGGIWPDKVIDFRGDCATDPLLIPSEVTDLHDFFSKAKAVDELGLARRELILSEIKSLTHARLEAESIQIRTQGWEDLCG